MRSVHRGAQGFVEFASDEADVKGHVPIYIYDRLDEPASGLCRRPGGLARHHQRFRDRIGADLMMRALSDVQANHCPAELIERRDISSNLAVFRFRVAERLSFTAGQYATIGIRH
jgi:hypothetical protein